MLYVLYQYYDDKIFINQNHKENKCSIKTQFIYKNEDTKYKGVVPAAVTKRSLTQHMLKNAALFQV